MSCLIERYIGNLRNLSNSDTYMSQWSPENKARLPSLRFEDGYVNCGTEAVAEALFWYNRDSNENIQALFEAKLIASIPPHLEHHLTIECSYCVDGLWTPYQLMNEHNYIQAATSRMKKGTLSGISNSGELAETTHYARVRVKLFVSPSSPAGQVDFKIAVAVPMRKEVENDLSWLRSNFNLQSI